MTMINTTGYFDYIKLVLPNTPICIVNRKYNHKYSNHLQNLSEYPLYPDSVGGGWVWKIKLCNFHRVRGNINHHCNNYKL